MWIGTSGILAFLVVDHACFIFVTVREAAIGEDYVLELFEGTYSDVWQGKLRVAMAWDQINL